MDVEYTDVELGEKFAEVLRHVCAGKTVVVLRDGEAVAEIRLPKGVRVPGETRYDYLLRTGQVIPAKNPQAEFPTGVRVEGALERFLNDRGRG